MNILDDVSRKIRGSMDLLRQHQQVRDVMADVSRKGSHKSGQETLEQQERCHCAHHSVQQMEKLFREAKVSDAATEALKQFSRDACNRLKQPPNRRQVACAHAEMFNDVVSMDANFWKLKERHSREKTALNVLNIVDAASEMHIASRIPNQTSHTLWKTFAHG